MSHEQRENEKQQLAGGSVCVCMVCVRVCLVGVRCCELVSVV